MTSATSALRATCGAAILAVLLWHLGTGPFLAGVAAIDVWTVLAAAGIAFLTTLSSAWRWSVVAGGLGVRLPVGAATAACYRSQFLNTTLPGGVLGDVDRAVRHGRGIGDLGRGVRAVVWERTAGQLVQAVLALVVLTALPSPARAWMPEVVATLALCGLGAALVIRGRLRSGTSRLASAIRVAAGDVRNGMLAAHRWPRIAVASLLVVAGHLATLLIAARAAGVTVPAGRLLPLVLLVLVGMTIPLSVGGWDPREGLAAWTFGAAGLGAELGVATATVYGVLVLVGALPGVAVVATDRRRLRSTAAAVHRGSVGDDDVDAVPDGAVHG